MEATVKCLIGTMEKRIIPLTKASCQKAFYQMHLTTFLLHFSFVFHLIFLFFA